MFFENITVNDVIRLGVSKMKNKINPYFFGQEDTFITSRYLTFFSLNLPYDFNNQIYFNSKITKNEYKKILDIFEKRINKRIPTHYLTNECWFGPLDTKFYVNDNVYIPRSPIVNYLKELIKDKKIILDMCCGSGALGIIASLLKDDCLIEMSDIDSKALKVAQKNIDNYRLNNRIKCIKSNLFKNIKKKYDLIIAVPPQISEEEYKNNCVESSYEPKNAYIANDNGFYFIKEIIDKAPLYLNKNGILIMETGIRLSENVKEKYKNLNIKWYKFNGKDCILKYVY